MDVDEEVKTSRRLNLRRKKAVSPPPQRLIQSNDSNGGGGGGDDDGDYNETLSLPSGLRPGIDVVLSLKDPVYKSAMTEFFRLLGGKKNATGLNKDDDGGEKEMAKVALLRFKHGNKIGDDIEEKGIPVRFFKPESRSSSRTYVEVNETAVLESKIIVFAFFVIFLLSFLGP